MAEEEVVDYDDDVNDEVVKNTLSDNNDTGYVQVKLLLGRDVFVCILYVLFRLTTL